MPTGNPGTALPPRDSLNSLLRDVTHKYIATLDPVNPPEPEMMERDLCEAVLSAILVRNAANPKEDQWHVPPHLEPIMIAELMFATSTICRIRTADDSTGEGYDMLGMYISDRNDPNWGTYTTDEEVFRKRARRFRYTLTERQAGEVVVALRDLAEVRDKTTDRDLIAVDNGIFNYATKELLGYDDPAFDPTQYVFTVKSHVPYNPLATNPVIHNDEDGTDWDIESWMDDISDDPEIVELLWQILSAIVRPNVDWDKSAWLYSKSGSNGKGTLCALMRNLCGKGAYASIPISAFSRDFMLEPLMHASAVIVDENDVGLYIDSAANLKAVITNDVVMINRKHKTPISYQFRGFMVQCLNEMPRIRDRSDSFYRRQLFIPFEKSFTGSERRYIKYDYMHRSDVLEYVMKKVLESNFYQLACPSACAYMLDEYKLFNDPVRDFFEECVVERARWNMLPLTFLYDLYKAWLAATNPSARPMGRRFFYDELITLVDNSTTWTYPGAGVKVRPTGRMVGPEPMILEYNLENWQSTSAKSNPDRRATPSNLSQSYRCILRAGLPTTADTDDD